MADKFFTQKFCDRCRGSLDGGRIMSMFNEDCICMACYEKERQHSEYKTAADAENAETRKGNYNFKGIGYPKK